ncbi:DUF1642 domain-containing protein [Lacticaseibacillus paracasei]|uniref:DUF1642 domain-containing protein n=1 Tax=Lacticaseibacillus paracasei TaxID=1597 RepID=UPI0040452862
MIKEKLYVIKSRSDDNFYFSGDRAIPNWSDNLISLFGSYEVAKEIAEDNNGQPVTFVEEPKKVVLTEEQAEIVERAHGDTWPAKYITDNTDDEYYSERILMEAFVNGYTVAKEKKYNVKVPHTKDVWYYKSVDGNLRTICPADKKLRGTFTEAEIEQYGLQDCEKEEVTDNDQ